MRSPRTATKGSPHLLQLEKARTQQRSPNTAKKQNKTLRKNKTQAETMEASGIWLSCHPSVIRYQGLGVYTYKLGG